MGESATSLRSIRVSYGTAVQLGLMRGALRDPPTTAYIFAIREKCKGRCKFCPQSIGSVDKISRVDWPEFSMEIVIEGLKFKKIERVCIQCADEERLMKVLPALVDLIRRESGVPISVSMSPPSGEELRRLREAGVDIVTIPIDCANRELFNRIKGRDWDACWKSLTKGLEIFGRGKLGTHIIVGLGEEERDVVRLMSECHRMGIFPSLFAFTPIMGTPLSDRPRPKISSYRRVQLARELIMEGEADMEDFVYDSSGRVKGISVNRDLVERIVEDGEAFMTRGCPSCNRPYFNERVSGPLYNYPRRPKPKEIEEIRRELFGGAEGLKVPSS
ncbi:MAG: radical SAM protein [Candidatus Methanomethylicaceae archaeon]